MMATDAGLTKIVRQRSDLARAMALVESAAAAPAGKESWVIDLKHALRQLEVAWNRHMVEMHAPAGLFDRIVDQAPRLQRAVDEMRADHTTLAEMIKRTVQLIADTGDPVDHNRMREAAVDTIVAVSRHRQRGADLIYEAYDVDIGGY